MSKVGRASSLSPNVHDLRNGSVGEFNSRATEINTRPFSLRDRLEALSYCIGSVNRDTESGHGDASLVGSYAPLRRDKTDRSMTWRASAGVRFPTGDSDRLKEGLNEVEVPGAPESAIHGHDLALVPITNKSRFETREPPLWPCVIEVHECALALSRNDAVRNFI